MSDVPRTLVVTSALVAMILWAVVAVGGENSVPSAAANIEKDFFIRLPDQVRPLPEPLLQGRTEPGFKIRGTKGWCWYPKQYLAEIPVLAKYKMNFLMNCYTSMCDIEHQPWTSGKANRWWEALPNEKKNAYERVVRACQQEGIQFCFCMNPNLLSPRILKYDDSQDLDALWQHYEWMQTLGVRWFSVCLDDISEGIHASGQAKAVNELFGRLRSKDPTANMIFCPTYYWGVGEDPKAREYLRTLARELHKDVYVFWTGPQVVSPRIPRSAAEKYKEYVGHRLIVWDNYPVNDNNPTLHLGPVTGRDPELCRVADGFMANPLCPQNEINRIPLLTIADYAYNPAAYDPARSIGQAIVHLTDTPEQRRALKDLVELYPGTLLVSKGTNWNPVLNRFAQITGTPHSRYLAEIYVRHVEDVANRLDHSFPNRFKDAVKTVRGDVTKMKTAYRGKYGE